MSEGQRRSAVQEKEQLVIMKPGLYANIHAKRKRIKAGSKEKMRKVEI
jgi:RecB family endonuclease NucS